jgi:hypothetical protein
LEGFLNEGCSRIGTSGAIAMIENSDGE